MAFDQPTRKRLLDFVSDARTLLTEEFTRQMQHEYGLNPTTGEVADLTNLIQLDDGRRQTARLLRETLEHYLATNPGSDRRETLERIVREQAFTVLNRLCALRMAEARLLLIESIGQGYQSKGFQLYARLAGTALGETGDAYRCYLFSLFDEFAVDLAVLFNRFSPSGRLFPREAALQTLLEQINHPEIDSLWSEDETIGWIYQYFNDPAERKKMRESAAPRNSRELAVRNQFFTPRYVVEFLIDNTLGRIWFEMTQGQTSLTDSCLYMVRRPNEIFLKQGEQPPVQNDALDGLSQDELLKQPAYIPFRPLKDPREIKMLDPACGSMHFGLYAFDLFERIYEEAWDLQAGGQWPSRTANGNELLTADYATKAEFLRDVPRLIIEYNIHGIDIDPRAAQIAGLSLWLRAQRAWRDADIKPSDRPRILRSNIVCAEPMPGEKSLLDEFISVHLSGDPERQFLASLVRKVFDSMKLAGEAGSLLKIEEEIADEIAKAKRQWLDRPAFKQKRLFAAEVKPEQRALDLTRGISNEAFWGDAEARIYEALRAYAEQAENGGGFQRRLFADDAAQGFAFIDLCRKRYDVVVMNPPFGNSSISSKGYLSVTYPKLWADIYSAFIERGLRLLCTSGRLGAITSRTFLALSSFETLRDLLLDIAPVQLVAECGLGVLDDATVRAAFYVAEHSKVDFGSVVFWDLRQVEDRGPALLDAIRGTNQTVQYSVSRRTLRKLPGKPFAYWLPERFLRFLSDGPHIDPSRVGSEQSASSAEVAVGASTTDDPRFVRCHWEVEPNRIGPTEWTRFAHAAGFCRFYAPSYAVLNWGGDGRQMLAIIDKAGNVKARLRCREDFLTRGLVSPYISERGLGCSYLPDDHILSNSCRAFFKIKGSPHALVGYLNSSFIDLMIWALTPDRKHEAGIIASLPVPMGFQSHEDALGTLARQSWEKMFVLRSVDECDPYHCHTFSDISTKLQDAANELAGLQSRLDDLVAEMVGEDARHLQEISAIAGAPHDLGEWLQSSDNEEIEGAAGRNIPIDSLLAGSRVSFAIGSIFGRWDIRYATGERPVPELPEPFAPLPVCPPGMLQGDDGLPLSPGAGRRLWAEGRYPLNVAWDGILADDPEHPLDLERHIHAALAILWGDRADELEHEVCALLGVPTLREWFRRPAGFFADHLKRYTKSRRQAPIYWPLSSASGGYTLWIYYHRITDQTLYTAVNDFVEPKLKQVATDAGRLRQKSSRTSADEKELEQVTDLEQELKDFRDELLRLAQFWKPNLNDGVLITAAPLWKLFRLPAWQKKLKETWQELEAGEYDWAHLAYSIWQNRVTEKCKTDKSLAIAHNLEHLYVELPKPAKKRATRKKKVEAEVEDEEFGE